MATDTVISDICSQMMVGIRDNNTKLEMAIRSVLNSLGFRFCVHQKDLPKKPNLVFSKYGVGIFIHGYLWYVHGCHIFKWPKISNEFWRQKISLNVARERKQLIAFLNREWRVVRI